MSSLQRILFQALAGVSLVVLGWDALQPRPDGPRAGPPTAPAPAPQPTREPDPVAFPQITHLTAERMLRPGQRLTLHGQVRGLTTANLTTLWLEGPDGTMVSTEVRDDGTHAAHFSVQHPTPALAPGAFSWKLRLHPSDAPVVLGVHVAAAAQPRVLLLMDHPSVEGARLQRWLAEAGSPVTTRTRVSAERYRVASAVGNAVDWERLDAAVLAAFDVVVIHAAALDRLSPAEHVALELAMRRDGLGLLILGSIESEHEAPNQGPQTSGSAAPLDAAGVSRPRVAFGNSSLVSPWLRPTTPSTEAPVAPRETRVRLCNGIDMESAVSVLAAELVVPPGGQPLVQDTQNRPLVVGASLGRGRWALSIVLDAWRWRQHGRGDDYARFWSTLLSAIARPVNPSAGAWSMAEATVPAFVDHPISLAWSSAPDVSLPTVEVQPRDVASAPAIPLTLNRSPSEPSHARAVFWPQHSGWHTVRALPSGPSIDIHVLPAESLPEIRAQFVSEAARRASIASVALPAVAPAFHQTAGTRPWMRFMAFLLFVSSAARLWRDDPSFRIRGRGQGV